MVTHNVSVMVVQAGAARSVLSSAPEQARQALLAVEASGRTAMSELRHLLGLLAPAGGDEELLVPQPGAARVPALVERVRAAGLSVELSVTGARDLPPGVDLAAYRVVQEALTNVIKHAGTARATVGPGVPPGRPGDHGDRRRPSGDGPGGAGGGRGLIGLRERIGLYGGELDAGPRPGGGWRVRARIPLEGLGVRSGWAGQLTGAGAARSGPKTRIPGVAAVSVATDPGPRVVVADDQTLVRGGFRLILGAAGIAVVAEAADGREAVAAALKHRPDVVLMDIRMPEMDGLEATRRILAAARDGDGPRIIMLTTFDLDQYVYAALSAGASGFLLKDVSPEHLVAAVRLVRCGDALLAPSITRRLVERFAPRAAGAGGADLAALTPRELEVLGLVARGLSNAELAATLTLSEATVKTHVARILAKLQLRDRVQAVVLAYETGLVSPGGFIRSVSAW